MNKKVQLIVLFAIFFILGGICIFTYNNFKFESNTVNNSDKLENTIKENGENEYKDENIIEENIIIDNSSIDIDNDLDDNIENNFDNIDSDISPNLKDEVIYQETEVIAYFTSIEEEFDNNKDNISFKDKAKNYFITVVDFLFYDSKINGYTFDELTNSAKLKILKIVFSIDNKIDSYFPDYKNIIKEKMNDIKGKIVIKYLEITAKICEEDSTSCSIARDDFNNLKNSYGITWNIVKEAIGNGYSSFKTILSEWYQSIKE